MQSKIQTAIVALMFATSGADASENVAKGSLYDGWYYQWTVDNWTYAGQTFHPTMAMYIEWPYMRMYGLGTECFLDATIRHFDLLTAKDGTRSAPEFPKIKADGTYVSPECFTVSPFMNAMQGVGVTSQDYLPFIIGAGWSSKVRIRIKFENSSRRQLMGWDYQVRSDVAPDEAMIAQAIHNMANPSQLRLVPPPQRQQTCRPVRSPSQGWFEICD